MKLFKEKPSLQVNFHQRKYRMLLWEFALFILLITVTNAINVLFPVETEAVRQGDYTFYMLFALLDILILLAMGFVVGIWYAFWYKDREVWKEDPNEP